MYIQDNLSIDINKINNRKLLIKSEICDNWTHVEYLSLGWAISQAICDILRNLCARFSKLTVDSFSAFEYENWPCRQAHEFADKLQI